MDIVYFNTKSKWDNELKYSIRSLEKYYRSLDNIFIVGYLPDYIDKTKVIHIPEILNLNETYVESYARYEFCKLKNTPDNFIIWCDDQYLLRPIITEEIVPYNVNLLTNNFDTVNMKPWQYMLYKSYNILKNNYGLKNIYNFESHTPFIINKNEFINIFDKIYDNIGSVGNHLYDGLCTITIYFNLNLPNIIYHCDNMRIGYYNNSYHTYADISSELMEKYYLSHDDNGLSVILKSVIENLFLNKSKFEL